MTQEEHFTFAREEREEAEKKAENSYKERQIALAESSNGLTASNVYVTWILAIFTAIGAAAAIYQGHIASKAAVASQEAAGAAEGAVKVASDTLQHTKDQEAAQAPIDKEVRQKAQLAAEASARLARQSLQATIDNFHLDQRPWVYASHLRLLSEPEEGQPFRVMVNITNSGRTPGLYSFVLTKIEVQYVELGQPKFDQARKKLRHPVGTIPPQAMGVQFHVDCPKVNNQVVTQYRQKLTRIYVFGKLYYADPFHASHWTTFCLSHGFGEGAEEFSFCSRGNEMDSK